jgi:hypothetical protein
MDYLSTQWVPRPMIGRTIKRLVWYIEDRVVDILDFQLRPKPLPPRPPAPDHRRHPPFHVCSVSVQRTDDLEKVDALWQQEIFKKMAKGFFDIRY